MAMNEMKDCGAHKVELEQIQHLLTHKELSKTFVLRGHGSIPIKVSRKTKNAISGWVRVEVESYYDIGIPLLLSLLYAALLISR